MSRLRPFFGYFGSKWRLSPKYPPPEYPLIVEPFAGAAGYSMLHHSGRSVVLCEKNPTIAGVWEYLISVTPDEILELPDEIAEENHPGANALMGMWYSKAPSSPRQKMTPWAEKYPGSSWWGPKIRKRIASQLPHIHGWKIRRGDYKKLPNVEATWYIDPPYQNHGQMYPAGPTGIDYQELRLWCQTRRGQVIVCEGGAAEWLPFRPLEPGKQGKRPTGAKSGSGPVELIWTNRD